ELLTHELPELPAVVQSVIRFVAYQAKHELGWFGCNSKSRHRSEFFGEFVFEKDLRDVIQGLAGGVKASNNGTDTGASDHVNRNVLFHEYFEHTDMGSASR